MLKDKVDKMKSYLFIQGYSIQDILNNFYEWIINKTKHNFPEIYNKIMSDKMGCKL